MVRRNDVITITDEDIKESLVYNLYGKSISELEKESKNFDKMILENFNTYKKGIFSYFAIQSLNALGTFLPTEVKCFQYLVDISTEDYFTIKSLNDTMKLSPFLKDFKFKQKDKKFFVKMGMNFTK